MSFFVVLLTGRSLFVTFTSPDVESVRTETVNESFSDPERLKRSSHFAPGKRVSPTFLNYFTI